MLAVAVGLAVVYGMSVEDGGPLAAAASVGILYALFVVWRSILLAFGVPKDAPTQAPAATAPCPRPADAPPPEEAPGGAGCAVLGAIGALAGLLLAKALAEILKNLR